LQPPIFGKTVLRTMLTEAAACLRRPEPLRRKHWAGVFANKDFVEGFASKFRPLVMTQEVKLLTAAPWGPHP
jgi:hypothetical protein